MVFSIIVPVYNIEKWLRQCVESVLSQTFRDYELILVDDGSTDESGMICDMFSNNYASIRVIHKKNGGVSDARNWGVKNAVGDYLFFLDGDDYISEWTLAELFQVINNKHPDIILSEGIYYESEGKSVLVKDCDKTEIEGITGQEALLKLTKKRDAWSVWAKCYKTVFWKQNQFLFKVGRRMGEDFELIYKVVLQAQTVYMIPAYYHYQTRYDSAMHSIDGKMIVEMLDNLKDWECYLKHHQLNNKLKMQLYEGFSRQLKLVIMENIYLVDKDERNTAFYNASRYAFYLKYNRSEAYRITYICIKLFGMRTTCLALKVLKKLRTKRCLT